MRPLTELGAVGGTCRSRRVAMRACAAAALALVLLAGACGERRAAPAEDVATVSAETLRARGPEPPAAIVSEPGDDVLRRAAERAGLAFRNTGPALPGIGLPPGGLPLAKLVATVAEQTGRSTVIDGDAVAARSGGVWITARFVLAGVDAGALERVALLDAGDPEVREGALAPAAEALGRAGTLLLGAVLLGDPDADVRSSAADLLGERRDGRAVEPLAAALGDEDEFVRQMARSSLLLQGEPAARPAVEAAARSGSQRAREMARALLSENWSAGGDATQDLPPDVRPDRALVSHDLEGLRRTASIAADGTAWLVVTTDTAVFERRAGRLEGAVPLLEALAREGVVDGRRDHTFGQPDLAAEPDEFVLRLLSDETDGRTAGDLRGAPRALRDALTRALDAAATLPAVAAGAAVTARVVAPAELAAARAAGDEPRSLASEPAAASAPIDACASPGAAFPCDPSSVADLFAADDATRLVLVDGAAFEITLLRAAAAGSGGRK